MNAALSTDEILSEQTLPDAVTPAEWARKIKRSALEDALSMSQRPGLISFALGLPVPELFPKDALAEAAKNVLSQDHLALQYGPPYQPLKTQIVKLMAERGVNCAEKQIFLTAGAQQGMNLLARLLLRQGGEVLVEESVYSGLRQVLEPFEPKILTVPTDRETGMDVDAVESLLAAGERPAFIYTVTDGNNPFGLSMSIEKRVRLVRLAQRYCIPIMEDDPYGFLRYESSNLLPLRALDENWVLYIGSFSKILAPALRVGWIVLPEALIPKLSSIKEAADINTSPFSQRVISNYISANDISNHLQTLRREYSIRRDAMLSSLERHFSSIAKWNRPSSGIFIWVEFPPEINTTSLLKAAVETEQVAFIPGHAFCADRDCKGDCRANSAMRLNFSHSAPELIEKGMARLAKLFNNSNA